MEDFLEWLKEEVLPGVWSKGVALSRNSKSVEKISPPAEKNELKFKIQTTERLLAFQVTLWPKEQDAHCNCDSKIEPCHHVVAVALALEAGTVTEPGEAAATAGSGLRYTWVVENQKINLKRELLANGVAKPLEGSLVGLIGGIQSGRIKAPLPSTTLTDIKLDEIFAKENPRWAEVFRALSDLPPLEVKGLPGKSHLSVDPKTNRPTLTIEDGPEPGSIKLTQQDLGESDRRFQNGISLRGDTLHLISDTASNERINEVIQKDKLETFLRERLPKLEGDFEIEVKSERLPKLEWKEPFLHFNAEKLSDDQIAVTASIRYPDPSPGFLVGRDLEEEQELIRALRDRYSLSLGTPKTMSVAASLAFRNKLSDQATSFDTKSTLQNIEIFLTRFFAENGNLTLETAIQNQDAILKLLALKEKNPSLKKSLPFLLQSLRAPEVDGTIGMKTSAETDGSNRKSSGSYDKSQFSYSSQVQPALWNKLRDYQKRGVDWLLHAKTVLGGAILSDDMGLGKTIQTLATLNSPALVVAPTSLLKNWQNEAALFRSDLKVQIFHGPNRKWDESADLTITSYALLRQEADRFLNEEWDTVVLDEAHIIRNPDTQAAVASFKLNSKFKLALTGTPIQNRRRDLLSLFQFVTPGIFQDESDLQTEVTQAFLLRRTKAQVLTELPPKTYLNQGVTLSQEERNLYDAVWATAKKEIVERLAGENANPFTLFEVLLRARQVCDHSALATTEKSQPSTLNSNSSTAMSSSKTEVLLELLNELTEAGHSILVYSQWTKFLDIIETRIKTQFRYLRLDGSTQNRGDVVDQFQNDERPSVFLLSLHAGGVGLNLTRATHVIFCDPWWNPFVELQAEDRAYRMGQEKPVTIHRLITENTIEEQMTHLQAEKMKLGEAVFTAQDLASLIK